MFSANGYRLEVPCTAPYCKHDDGKHSVVAYWPAPFFVLIQDDDMAPLLIHCEDRAYADMVLQSSCGRLLDAEFVEVSQ